MKKELRKAGYVMAMAVAFSLSPAAFAEKSSKDGARPVVAQGRAVLSVEDAKALLGLESRDPSSATQNENSRLTQEESNGLYSLKISPSLRGKLVKVIREIERQRETLSAKAAKEAESKKAQIRNQRRAIQESRLKSEGDMALGKSLYESFLAEANIEAAQTRKLQDFDASHLIVIEYQDNAQEKRLASVAVGQKVIWSKTTQVARY